MPPEQDIEVTLANDHGRAVIQGKTSVPFKTFVSLILQRKVQTLFKTSQDEPVIVGSELLTKLASAPDDSREDRGRLVLVTLGVGVLTGVFLTLAALVVLSLSGIQLSNAHFSIVLAFLAILGFLTSVLRRAQKTTARQKLTERMEGIAELLSK